MRNPDTAAMGRIALLLVTVSVAACGGGGGDSGSAAAPVTSPAPVVSADDPTATCNLSNFAAQALALVNQKRAAGANCGVNGSFPAAGALAWKAKLNQAATGHSSDMSALNFFSHTSQDGRTLANRIDATGYTWSTIGENIAAGYPTVQAVVDGWMASDGHCANIMNAQFTEMGLACVAGAAGDTYANYWTMDLARPR